MSITIPVEAVKARLDPVAKHLSRIFGIGDQIGPGQYFARVTAFVTLAVTVGIGVDSYASQLDACYPYCQGATASAPAVRLGPVPATTVAFYGDSRAFGMAEGAAAVPGWQVHNHAVPGCGWRDGHPGHQDASVGDGHECGTNKYVPQTGHHNLAIVYAGTLLSQDVLTLSAATGVTGYAPTVEAEMVDNVVRSIGYIDADRVVVLGTPIVKGGASAPGVREYVDRMNAILAEASARAGAIWLPEFAGWVESQPPLCQPDGTHFTLSCAATAAAWVQATLATAHNVQV